MSKESCVSAIPTRRRAFRAVVAGALSLVLLAGCTSTQRDASDYDGTEDNFLEGCEAQAKADADVEGATVIESPKAWCACVFDAIKADVDFDRFKEVNSELRDAGGPLPDDIQKAYDSCDPGVTSDG
ncbi:MAG TPA: hypothetical protein P5254_08985 [Aquihabitans sp.]|nr:hypothetical protein [Aquihabitans sp.]